MATIEEIRGLAESLKGYQFKVTIASPPGEGASIEVLQFRVQSSVLPGRTIDPVVTSLGGYDITDPGRIPGPRTWTTTFTEGTDVQILQRIDSWQKLCFDPETGVQGSRADVKRIALFELLDNAKNVTLSRQIVGIWPQDLTDVPFDNASSENVAVDVTWSYDYHI